LKIAKFLDKNKVNYKREQTFDGCMSPKGSRLRFDFFLEDHNMCIEFQGEHHFKPVNKYKKAADTYKRTICHDEIKRNYLAERNILLLQISYSDYDNIESILQISLLI
jgi:hypothetical protein